MVNELKRNGVGDMSELKQEIMFNRGLLWLVLAHVTENQMVVGIATFLAALSMLSSFLGRALSR